MIPASPADGLSILAPEPGAIFESGFPVILRASGGGTACRWRDGSGLLVGRGSIVSRVFPEGEAQVRLEREDAVQDEVRFRVEPPRYRAGTAKRRALIDSNFSVELAAGCYSPVVLSWGEDECPEISLSRPGGARVARSSPGPRSAGPRAGDPIRDIALVHAPPSRRALSRASSPRGPADDIPEIGDLAAFRMADVSVGTAEAGCDVEARLFYIDDRMELWIDAAADPDHSLVNSAVEGVAGIVVPRVTALWGRPVGPEESCSRIAVLMCPRLNDSGRAIGFFNPGDFYPYDGEEGSADYNPTSNHRMIVYCGIPEGDPESYAYSADSIIATVGHELQHLIAYSRTSYAEWLGGDPDPFQEATWLSEACAHLTESLCGFGETGGNLLFFARYAEAPWRYSLGGIDLDGAEDSPGKRGGSAALLFRLFEEAGGARFESLELVDDGGAAFLRSLVDPRDGGWEKIARIRGMDPSAILEDWAEEIALSADSFLREACFDSLTGQRIDLGFFLGELPSPKGGTLSIRGPARADFRSAPLGLAPLSLAWGTPFELAARGALNVVCRRSEGKGCLILAMPE